MFKYMYVVLLESSPTSVSLFYRSRIQLPKIEFSKLKNHSTVTATFSMSGGELFERAADENNRMTEADALEYVRQVCEGLKHMHENSYVHLDIKVCKISSKLPLFYPGTFCYCFSQKT